MGALVQAAPACTALVDVAVLSMVHPGTDRHSTVLVRGSAIATMGPVAKIVVLPDCQRIDCRGRYLIPGLVDTHAHFFGYSKAGEGDLKTEQSILRMLLANGVTTAA